MLRIVGVQKSELSDKEFVLLQNQGSMRVNLRGHALISESAFSDSDLCGTSHAFVDDTYIAPGLYVILYSGYGMPRWVRSRDGANVYQTYMNSETPVWSRCALPLHILNTQHSYVERGEPLLLR